MDDGLWVLFGQYVNIPLSEKMRIKRQYFSDSERKQAVISSLISSHPALSWRLVANALYQMAPATINAGGGDGASCHRALDHLQKQFPTGIYMYMYMYIVFSILLLTCTVRVKKHFQNRSIQYRSVSLQNARYGITTLREQNTLFILPQY